MNAASPFTAAPRVLRLPENPTVAQIDTEIYKAFHGKDAEPTTVKTPNPRKDPMNITVAILLLMSSISAMAAAYLGIQQEQIVMAVPSIEQQQIVMAIMDDQALRIWCICGALCGAAISIIFFPVSTPRKMAMKWVGSSLTGAIFTPVLMRWQEIPFDTDYLLASSAGVALLSWTLIQAGIPIVETRLVSMLDWLKGPSQTPKT